MFGGSALWEPRRIIIHGELIQSPVIYIGVTLNQLKATKNLRKQKDRQECDTKLIFRSEASTPGFARFGEKAHNAHFTTS